MPRFVIIGMLFGLLMSVSHDRADVERQVFSSLTVFAACSGLFISRARPGDGRGVLVSVGL